MIHKLKLHHNIILIIFVCLPCLIFNTGSSSPLPGSLEIRPNVQIIAPTNDSSVTSPLNVIIDINCNLIKQINFSIIDRNFRVIFRKVKNSECSSEGQNYLTEVIYFDIYDERIPARLQVEISDKFDRTISITSREIFLVLNDPMVGQKESHDKFLIISSPLPNQHILGEIIRVEGSVIPHGKGPIIIELVNETGQVLNSKQLKVPENDVLNQIDFKFDLPFKKISTHQNLQLLFRQLGTEIPGNVIMQNIVLNYVP